MKLKFERATTDDVEVLINIRNQCFYADYLNYGECPGYNISKENMVNSVLNNISYKIILDTQIIGNISVRDNRDNTYYLSCLCVIPEYENKGIGKEAIRFIENEFPNATLWTLVTPADKISNHYFYQKAGYTITRECMDGSVKLVLFEKTIDKRQGEKWE